MKKSKLFIGRPVYWVLFALIVGVMAFLGMRQEHVRDFVPFQFAVIGVAVFAVAAVLFLYRPGEEVTRDPLDPDDLA